MRTRFHRWADELGAENVPWYILCSYISIRKIAKKEGLMKFNGTMIHLNKPIALSIFLNEQQLNSSRIAVEQNGTLVEKQSYATTVLENSDVLEIVTFVGGG